MAKSHPAVKHPHEWERKIQTRSDRFIKWVTDHVLASAVMFYIALIAPLMVIPMSDQIKLVLGIIASNWIQWWALPALQRSQNNQDAERKAKNEADHEVNVHIATTVDENKAQVNRLESIILHPSNQEPPRD